MDEPLSNLDAKLRVAMRGELIRLHQQYRTTTLYVTHDQIEAMTLGDRIAVLNEGRLQQIGTPDELYRSPVNVFVAGFIGSPAMNLARGRLTDRGDGPILSLGGHHHWPVPQTVLDRLPDLGELADHEVIMGLRPSALSLDGTDPDTPRISVTAITVESLGDEKNILFLPPFDVPDVIGTGTPAAGAETELTAMWTARVAPDAPIVTGQQVTLHLDLNEIYLFDAATGLAVQPADDRVLTN
jgi:multiple sugar transport system ATP-binding protein